MWCIFLEWTYLGTARTSLVVHEFVTNGDRLAMRFGEQGCSSGTGGNGAVWSGFALYRWDGERLLENFVEKDFSSQERQLTRGDVDPLPPPHVDPWTMTKAEPTDPEAEEAVQRWLGRGDLSDADHATIDSSREGLMPSLLDVESVEINDLFSAGHRVAFPVSLHGAYRGGFPKIGDDAIGASATLRCAGIATLHGSAVTRVRAVTDRAGIHAELDRG